MKKFILTLCLLTSLAYAGIFEDSFKSYNYDADLLFMSALSAINSNSQFEITEIQSRNGYILFLYGAKYYLLTLTKQNQNQTEIKILPQNSDYAQGNEAAKIIFNLIDNQLKNQPMEKTK